MSTEFSYASQKQKYLDISKITLLYGLVLAVGYFLGAYVPKSLVAILLPITLVALIVGWFLRLSRSISLGVYSSIVLILGMGLHVSILYYVSALGAQIVATTAIGVFIIFIVFSFIGAYTKKDLSSLFLMLFVGFMVMLILSLVNLFIIKSALIGVGVSAVFCLLYTVSMIVDMNLVKNTDFGSNEAPMFAFNLILNPIGLFLRLLNIFDYLK